ncbi:MAG: 3-hydroxyacyl-ACP dehydratase FabZ [Sutterellaceae bacterium]|nr:3-hydroxyacyl-ACP dehydratase FabZ [Sutterellaceae bacterium]MDD7442068.1 3-hydroxyacyl-ACP dehydratase FabZ [Sutterellaceae bacterium]MDY2869145.1 3-hydroxyacyl-ACP dehydratase FabZ [Mesosutterella sp.]
MQTLKIYEIMKLLPHRFPFLLVDRVESVSDDLTEIVAYKNVTANEPQFTGHFPGAPVMPGVLIIEAMAQACGVLAMLRLPEEERTDKNSIYYFAGIDHARFKRVVLPGDKLTFHGKYLKDRMGIAWFEGTATVDGELACKATLMCARRKIHE